MMIIEGKKWEEKYEATKALPNPEDYESADEKALFTILRDNIPTKPN